MANLTQMELNTIKEMVALEDVNSKKFKLYADNCHDAQLQNLFNNEARQASNTARALMNFLIQ
jgi:hypothetical protein